MMKIIVRKLLFVLCVAVVLTSHAQDHFSRRYDPFSQLNMQEAWSVEFAGDSGYCVVHMSRVTSQGVDYLVPCILSLDLNGDVLHVAPVPIDTLYPAIFCGWSNSSARTPNGDIIIGGGRSDETGFDESALLRFDSAGEFDTMFVYGNDLGYIGRQAKSVANGYLLVGGCDVNNNYEGFLLKTDANGTQEWVQIYPGPSYDELVAVDLAPGGSYYLGGLKFVPGQDYQHWLLHVDAEGEVLWEKVWGGVYYDSNAHLVTTGDGNVVIASAKGTAVGYVGQLYLAKLNSVDGSVVWQRSYGAPNYSTTLFGVKEVEPNGDLISPGLAYRTTGEIGVLLRTTSEGDSLWMRYYDYDDGVVTDGDALLHDVLPTPDGGFIAVGVAYGIGPYSQDVWVVKTDSMGCLEPGCHLVTGMETQITNLRDALTVVPNPVASGGTVQVSIALPENFVPQGNLRLTVVSSDGRVVQEHQIATGTGSVPLSLGEGLGVRPGLYHLHLSDATRWISGAKLVVE